MKPATIGDVMDLAKGHVHGGSVQHEDCGGTVTYTFVRDAFVCSGCQMMWDKPWVKTRTNQRSHDATYWVPPMMIDDCNAE